MLDGFYVKGYFAYAFWLPIIYHEETLKFNAISSVIAHLHEADLILSTWLVNPEARSNVFVDC